MNNFIKKASLSVIAIMILVTTPTYAQNITNEENVIERFNALNDEIKAKNDLIFNNSRGVLNEEYLKESEDVEVIKEELYNLISENPEEFKGFIISDAEKEKALEKEISSRGANHPTWNNYGDIFVRKTSIFTPSLTGHAGIGDYDKGFTIESYPDGGVQYRIDYSKWKKESTAGIYRPYNATDYGAATNYAIARIGEPYNSSFKSTGSGYYCSELVYYSWLRTNGINIRVASGNDYIVPVELANSANTYQIDWPY